MKNLFTFTPTDYIQGITEDTIPYLENTYCSCVFICSSNRSSYFALVSVLLSLDALVCKVNRGKYSVILLASLLNPLFLTSQCANTIKSEKLAPF